MFWERYSDLCQKANSTPNGVAKIIGVSNATCTKWKGGAVPTGDSLIKIASHFDCSVDYLLGRTDNPQSHKNANISFGDMSNNSGIVGNVGSMINNAPAALDNHQILLLELYNKLSPIEQIELIASLNNGEKKS